jgi:hypothetical protein
LIPFTATKLKGTNMFQSRKDYKKTDSIMDSCKTIQQLNTAMNMIHNYGKMYNYNHYWRKLDIKSFNQFMYHLDMIEYKKKLEEIANEQEASIDTESESV